MHRLAFYVCVFYRVCVSVLRPVVSDRFVVPSVRGYCKPTYKHSPLSAFPAAEMYSMSYPLAMLATCVASANAFMATGPVLRASPAPAIARANRTPLKMEAAVEKPKIGALAEKYSGGFAHPATHADDGEIRKILPHRSVLIGMEKSEHDNLRFLRILLRGEAKLVLAVGMICDTSPRILNTLPSTACLRLGPAALLDRAAVTVI